MNALLALLALSLGDIVIKDEGVSQGAVTSIDCIGAAVTCSRLGSTGIIRIDAGTGGGGTGGGGGGTSYVFAAPIYNDGGSVGCLNASGSIAGCVSTGTQTIAGAKTFTGPGVFSSTLDVQGFLDVYSTTKFVSGGGVMQSLVSGGGVTLLGNRDVVDSVSPEVQVGGNNDRDAGPIFLVNAGNGATLFEVDATGNVYSGAHKGGFGQFIDSSGSSGHVGFTVVPKQYVAIMGQLGANHDAIQTDGGRPIPDGGNWVKCETDGGCYYTYGALHGETTTGAVYPRWAGWVAEFKNPLSGVGAATDTRAYVDFNGGFGQAHGLSLSQFDPGITAQPSSLGTLSFGQAESTLMYAFDKHRWYTMNELGTWSRVSIDDGGTYGSFSSDGGVYGSVTSTSVTTANGISGSVATASTTPAITLTLGAITPNSVAAVGAVTGSNLSGTNTGDQSVSCPGGQFVDKIGAGTSSTCSAPVVSAGTITMAMLAATGAPSPTTFLRGDGVWYSISAVEPAITTVSGPPLPSPTIRTAAAANSFRPLCNAVRHFGCREPGPGVHP